MSRLCGFCICQLGHTPATLGIIRSSSFRIRSFEVDLPQRKKSGCNGRVSCWLSSRLIVSSRSDSATYSIFRCALVF